MRKSLILLLILTGLFSCKQNNRFHVSGTVKDADGLLLYIEHSGLLKTTVLDSVRLGSDGKFNFKADRPEYPDFYRLRIDDKVITFAVDSCEDICFTTQIKNFAIEYNVKGSLASKQIQQLRKSVMAIQQKVNNLTNDMASDVRNSRIAEIKKDIEVHKEIARHLILQNPRSTAAYFAIYQQVNETYLFSPYIKTDKPYCAAVATSYYSYMPDYVRTKNLYSLVMDAIRTERSQKSKEAWDEVLEKVAKGYIDIDLKDNKNVSRKLSDLEGKVVLIDFSAYETSESVDYTFALRDLFNKYHNRGFEIYQISLDRNKLLWEKSVENIPWVCVRDEKGPNTTVANLYNVNSIPTTYLMDRKGTIVSRSLGFNELDKQIQKIL